MNTCSIWNKCKYLFCCLILTISHFALASPDTLNHTNNFSYTVDYCQSNTQIIDIENATKCKYEPQYSPLKQGFGESSRWIRLQVHSNKQPKESISIRVSPYFLKNIQFFSQIKNEWLVNTAGSRVSDGYRHDEVGGYTFITSLDPKNENTYYLKIQASSLTHISVKVRAWPNSDLDALEKYLGLGAQIGLLTAILVFSLVSLGLNPSIVMGRFCAFIFNLILCILAGSGILSLYIFEQELLLNQIFFNWVLCLRLGLWIWVSQAFLISYNTPRWYKPSCWFIYGLVGVCMLLAGLEKANISNSLMLAGVIVAPITQIIAIHKTVNISRPFKIVMILGFSISILLIFLAVASVLFPLQNNNQIPVYLSRLTDFVTPLVMLSIIVYQNRLIRKELVEVKSALTETRLRSEFETKLLKDRTTLIDMLAHELKNPLASIGLAVDTLSQSINTSNPNDRQRLRNINQSIINMDDIIERCSLMNLIDQKTLPLRLEDVNIKAMLVTLIENHQGKQAVDLSVDDDLSIQTDPQFLQIILANLIENGLKYSPAKTRLKVMIEKLTGDDDPRIRISITNTIHPDLAPDPKFVFERFYRHRLAQKTRGSGLGLYICKELCHVLGGTIEYRYIANEITFLVELPA